MKKLTKKQRQVWQMRDEHPDWSFERIGQELGIAGSSASRRFQTARLILGPTRPVGNEAKDADLYGELLAEVADPRLRPIAETAIAEGLGVESVKSLLKALNHKYIQTNQLIGEIKTDELIKTIDWGHWRIWQSIARMSDEDIDEVPLRDRAVAAAIMVDKSQLLKNKPTEIVRTQQEVEKLTEIGGWMMREIQRRAAANEQDIDLVVDPETGRAAFVEME